MFYGRLRSEPRLSAIWYIWLLRYTRSVSRVVATAFAVLLAFSTSGVVELMVPEPCGITDQAGGDMDCAPTCHRCTCCAQAVALSSSLRSEPASVVLPERPTAVVPAVLSVSREIFHVPKIALS